MPGKSSSNEQTKPSKCAVIFGTLCGLGLAGLVCLLIAAFMLMYISFGDQTFTVLLKGITP